MCEIMRKLFESDLDQIIQNIFLSLDPLTLKSCRQVCSAWNSFILLRLWGSKPVKHKLGAMLTNEWRSSQPATTVYSLGIGRVSSIVCDGYLIVCGYSQGQVRGYHVDTGELRYELQCNYPPARRSDEVQLVLSKNMVATVTESGTVSLWNKLDGTLLYQAAHHVNHLSVHGIMITDEFLITGAGDGTVVIVENIEEKWMKTHELHENTECVTHVDVDGKWAAIGTRNSITLLDLVEHKLVENVKPIQVKGWMLSFLYPHVFVVGGIDFPGVQVWDMVGCVMVRHVAEGMQPFHHIHTNGHFLTVSEYNDMSTADGPDRSALVVVFDITELIDTSIDTNALWKKSFDFSPSTISAVATKTSLIVSHNKNISILRFWSDRIIPSRVFEPPTKMYQNL